MAGSAHHISLELEMVTRRSVLADGRGAMYVFDADYIDMENGAYIACVVALAPYYRRAAELKNHDIQSEINQFIGSISDIENKKVSECPERIKQITKEIKGLIEKYEQELMKG